jgi:hypothetical protein
MAKKNVKSQLMSVYGLMLLVGILIMLLGLAFFYQVSSNQALPWASASSYNNNLSNVSVAPPIAGAPNPESLEHEATWNTGYYCVKTNSENYNDSQWLTTCQQQYNFQTCQGNPQSGCPISDGYPDADCGWAFGTKGVMCFTYGANPPFGRQTSVNATCDGVNEGVTDLC